jgi:putative addiction module killer protein
MEDIMDSFSIEIYENENGSCPYDDWIDSLDKKTAARIEVKVRRFKSGNFGDHKMVGEGVFESRIFFGPGYRIYFSKVGNKVILLLSGGDKSSQAKDIRKAQECLKIWRQENG